MCNLAPVSSARLLDEAKQRLSEVLNRPIRSAPLSDREISLIDTAYTLIALLAAQEPPKGKTT